MAMGENATWSSFSFTVLMIAIGLPVWWKTTEVYRVDLPYDRIDALSNFNLQNKINVVLVTLDVNKDHQLGPNLQSRLTESQVYSFLLTARAPTAQENGLLNGKSPLDRLDDELYEKIHNEVLDGTVLLMEIPGHYRGKQITVGKYRTIYFTRTQNVEEDAARLANVLRNEVLSENSVIKALNTIESPSHNKGNSETLRRVTPSVAYDILFTLLVPEPDKNGGWDIKRAKREYIKPLLDGLSNVSDFTVKSQILYMKNLNLKPRRKGDFYVVDSASLGLAINPIEGHLATHVSSRPRLNFLVYIPPKEKSPLYIDDKDAVSGNAFLIPRWGGVLIYNGDNRNIDVDKVMRVFVAQIKLLLGLKNQRNDDFDVLPPKSQALRFWEKDFLYRFRTLEHLVHAKVTLQALAHLLNQISNIVINDEIGDEVFSAVSSAENASELLSDSSESLEAALKQAKMAFAASEKAFFDPSLLALLYFPEDQKYAIYIPLFLPVGIPIIMSIKPLIKFVRNGFKVIE